jgi:hypothetical protein
MGGSSRATGLRGVSEGKLTRIFFGHFQIRDRNPLNAQTKADPITSTNAGGTNASATGSRSQAIPPNFTSPSPGNDHPVSPHFKS